MPCYACSSINVVFTYSDTSLINQIISGFHYNPDTTTKLSDSKISFDVTSISPEKEISVVAHSEFSSKDEEILHREGENYSHLYNRVLLLLFTCLPESNSHCSFLSCSCNNITPTRMLP